MNCACSWYPGLEAIIICSLYVLMVITDEESSLSFRGIFWGQTTCMMDEYTFKWLPTSLQCIPPWNMSMAHSQYLLFRNTGFSELSLDTFIWGFVTLFDP